MSALTLSRTDRPGAWLAWLHQPLAYTVGAPIMMVAGAATTLIAPRLLTPASFAQFALLASVVQYVTEFDLGLGRLTDRRLSRGGYQPGLMGSLFVARLWLALVLLAVLLLAVPFVGGLTALAGLAGVGVMLCNGPITFFRAQSRLAAFTLSALAVQAGLSLPRLAGLLMAGVPGCILALATWYVGVGLILTLPLITLLRRPPPVRRMLTLFTQSAPLFAFGTSWLLFLLANRWFAWLLSNPTDTGLFAFGANLVAIGTGLISMVVQAYYPRHLTAAQPMVLAAELWRLLAMAMVGIMAGAAVCGIGFGQIFPNFTGAERGTAALLITGAPLSLCAWLLPLIIARSRRPARDAAIMFGTCLAGLFACMAAGSTIGLDGLAWGCLPPTLGLLGWHLRAGVRDGLLMCRAAVTLWATSLLASAAYGAVWLVIFHAR